MQKIERLEKETVKDLIDTIQKLKGDFYGGLEKEITPTIEGMLEFNKE